MTIEFARPKGSKDKKKRKRRGFGAAKKAFMEGRKGGRKSDSFEGVGGMLKDAVGAARSKDLNRKQKGSVIGGAAGYAAGVVEGKGRRGAKSLGERGSAALGKAKDYMSKAKSAASELSGKAKSAVSSGYSAVKEKAQDVLKKRKRGNAASYARAIEALEFEVAKQVGILEFASGHNYIEFARPKGSKDKKKRKRRGMSTAAKVGLGAAGIAGTAAAVRYGGAGLAQKGLNKALKGSNLTKGEAIGSFRQGAVNAIRSDAAKVGSAAKSVASAPGKAYRRVRGESKAIGRSYRAGRKSGMGRLESARRAVTTKNKVKRNTGSFKGLGR